MNEEEFDKLSLPKDSANENLETLSRLKLAELFSPELFELRDELQHDKGVDIFIELKRRGNFTNFRFAVQLKSTRDGSINNDGSVSFALDVSNINYLMNHCMPAYYILYKAGSGIFSFVDAFTVHEELKLKYAGKELPKTYSYRFGQTLDVAAIQQLYDESFEKGRLFRSINPLLQMSLQQNQSAGNIVINDKREVYTTKEKVEYLERFGFRLLNAAEFIKVIELEQQCYPLPKVTGAFHFVVGMAYYHQANMYRAIDHFKKSEKMMDDLHPEMGVMLGYHTALAKFALGLLSRSEINRIIDKYKHSSYVGLYLRITEAYVNYVKKENEESVKYALFYQTLDQIKADPACDANIRLMADAQALQVEGQRLNDQLFRELSLNRAMPMREILGEASTFDNEVSAYNNKVKALENRAQAENNMLTYLIICLNSLKINYSAIAMAYCVNNFDEVAMSSIYIIEPEARIWLEERNAFLENTADFYFKQGFLENMVVALSLKYEILHFIGDSEAAEIVRERVSAILEANDLLEFQRKFKLLISGGTVHEITIAMLVESFKRSAVTKSEAGQLQQEMEAFDMQEKQWKKAKFADQMNIDIFALGWFAFPGAAFEDVMDALRVERAVREQFEWMLKDGIMARVNALQNTVTSEGHGNGMGAHRGIESQRNLHRIRKYFFEQGYHRLK